MTKPIFNGLKPLSVLFAVIAVLMATTITPAHAQTKMVFAHYMVTNQDYGANVNGDKVQGYMREIQQAQAAGIDGFILNCGGWINTTYYITYTEQIFQAALNLNTGFKLFMSCDFCCGNTVNDAEDMMRRLCNDPNYSKVYFKYNNKWVLTTFDGAGQIGTGGFQQIRNDLANGTNPNPVPAGFSQSSTAALQTFIVPAFFWGGEVPTLASIQSGWSQWSSTIDGSVYWGIAGVPGSGGAQDQVPSSQYYAQTVHGGGKLYMAPVCFQFWGANANRYFEYSGYSGLRKMFMDAINTTHPEWIEIITWNDFVEGTYVSPIDDPNKYPNSNYLQFTNQGYYHTHAGASALLPYFISWYKNGAAPALTQDSIYWAYRTHSQASNPGNPSVANKYGPVADSVYVTCNLTSAATVKVTCGSNVQTINAAAGSNDYAVPFTAGNIPNFQVIRGSTTELNVNGTDQIQTSPSLNDYYYSTGSASCAPQGGGGTAPGTPAGLTATAGNSQVGLSWGAVSGATSYNIYRSTTAGGEGTTAVATSASASYTNTGLTNGTTYYFKVAAVNASGTSSQSTEVSARPQAATEAPYGGTAAAIPGTVQVENYDTGGEGLAYHDAEAANQGGQYRTSDGVDIETCGDTGGGYDEGWTNGGEWTRYTVNVSTAGTYTVTFRVADGNSTNGTFHLANSGGTNLSGTVTVTPTGGWQTWVNVTANVTLPAGTQILTVADDTGGYNLNYMTFASSGGGAPGTPSGLSATGGNSQVALTWTAVSGATSYNIYRSTTSGGEGTTAVATSSTASYTNTGLTNGTTYYYKVAAVNASGTSGQSSEASATPQTVINGIDLIVTNVTWSPTSITSGAHVVFSYTIKNQGNTATAAGVVLGGQFQVDGNTSVINWEDNYTSSLAPGASVTLTATGGTNGTNYWVATSGSHTITGFIDDVNRISEANETNNKLTVNFSVP